MTSLKDLILLNYKFNLTGYAETIADLVSKTAKDGKIITIFGNGGSASDAQHWAAELVCTYQNLNRQPYPALALTVDTSILTAWSNDFSFDSVFSRQLEAFSRVVGLAIGLSTSGKSKNVLYGLNTASKLGANTILITGSTAPSYAEIDHVVRVPSTETPVIQSLTQMLYHEVCANLEDR